MHGHRPSIANLADDLPGHTVVLADGDEIGIVAGVVATPEDGCVSASHALVVHVDGAEGDVPPDALVIADESVLAVTDDAVVLGTTASWLGQHILDE